MITPIDIRKKAENKISEVLKAWLEKKEFFPFVLRSDKSLTANTFDVLNQELILLLQGSRDIKGYGYKVELKEVSTRKLGKQKLPDTIVFETPTDFWKYIGKENQWLEFQHDSNLIRKELPQLESWLLKNPLKVMVNAGKWSWLLEVCKYFIVNPKPGCYLREIPAQPHTKFIEEHKGILELLLTEVIGDYMRKESLCFEERFHLKTYERLLQIRLLDQTLAQFFSGVSHIGITIPDLARLNLPCKRVIIMENKANYSNVENVLTLPHMKATIAIFGSGYAVNDLRKISWLQEKEIWYWGDIDVQGFEMLSMVRGAFNQTKAILMDKEVFDEFSDLRTGGTKSSINQLAYLTDAEQAFYNQLKNLTENNRLEQERIPQWYVIKMISMLK